MAAGTMTAVGQSNTYIPNAAATGRMQVEFSRNPNDFGLPNYVQIRKVTKDSGYYLRIDQRNCSRIVGGNIDEFVWPDGHDRPVLNNNGLEFAFVDYRTVRRNFGQQIGDKARQQAEFDLEGAQERTQAQKAMTVRTKVVHSALGTDANWDADHIKDVATSGIGGQWSAALSTNPLIKKSLNFAQKKIALDTGAVVKKKDLILVMNPTTALLISETQELIDHIKQSPDAYSQIQGTGKWSEYGLPDRIYGFPVVVEDAVITTTPRGAATQTSSFVMPDGVAYILSRPGGLVSKGGGPSFSTVTLFAFEEMTVESDQDKKNRRITQNVVDDIAVGLTAPVAGMKLTNLY
jgi:hypothetical protein